MLDVTPFLEQQRIPMFSTTMAVTVVGDMLRDAGSSISAGRQFLNKVLDVNVSFPNEVYARVATKYVVKELVDNCGLVEDVNQLVQQAHDYAKTYCADSKNSYLFARPDDPTKTVHTNTHIEQVTDLVETKVAVHSDTGKIKKGGKQQLAVDLYKKHVTDMPEGQKMSNKDFKKLLMDELDMTEQGASTYAYNVRKVWI